MCEDYYIYVNEPQAVSGNTANYVHLPLVNTDQ